MTILALSVVLAVLLIVYFFNRLIETNILVIKRAMTELKEGNYSVRISRKWKREFGSLANIINTLAENLQYQSIDTTQKIKTEGAQDQANHSEETLDHSETNQHQDEGIVEEQSAEPATTDNSDGLSEFTVVQTTTDN